MTLQLAENTTDTGLYPKGWTFCRDGYFGHNEDDYHFYDSWTASKIFGGLGGPYAHKLRMTIRVRVVGKRVKGRLRAARWWASAEFGVYDTIFGLGIGQPGGKCSSVADAIRQADASPEVAAMVEQTIRALYTTRRNVAAYFRITSHEPNFGDPPEHPPKIEEYLLAYRPVFGAFDFLPCGKYAAFSWYCEHVPTRRWVKRVTIYEIFGSGGASSCSPKEHERFVPLFPEWLPMPTEAP